ncbi:hypothetical protein COW99_01115 [Candidatus Roizmanbacteria bacterium CG22_combo_CG10-13_8_21_14_all_38_20]|uniref:Uncharacterized protein n=1 Tax=Candidatus Roizmanbacteria bacterium CG22_combo_CG10-13_8_21_14_all_38_20 TaxID=1974862 RepID=A0A2H0BWD1_9BACT|nr:hypothetical protein [Candidatus Microgenomates bacterium]PIP61982.1 MAG: hypothetical protein COW99_01115 [Candidatus Roizmanbacteria bacterium CG22_combo_CG10-13_8_21_14_all_38_20]PJC31920.1 MAG: hypothetical protein CO050_01770 [Candidatus Roizmanbacteria bacterium CG_4_9_14_0_2_um_filter_38_17]
MTTKAEVSTGGDFFDVVVATGDRTEWTIGRDVFAWLQDTTDNFGFVGARLGIRFNSCGPGDTLYNEVEVDKRDVENWGKLAKLVTSETVKLRNIEFSS